MARIKFGAVVTGASGKIGGHVFSNSMGGATLSTKSNKGKGRLHSANSFNSSSNLRSIQGAVTMTGLAQQWRTLTNNQRLAWQNAAQNFPQVGKMGDTIFLRGYHLFIKTNVLYSQTFGNVLDLPPTAGLAGVAGVFSASASFSGDITIGWSADWGVNYALIVSASMSVSIGLGTSVNKIKQVVTIADGTDFSQVITNEYKAVYGDISVGAKLFFSFQLISELDATLSIPVVISCIVAP